MSSCFVRYVLKSEEIDTVIHFAAQSHVGTQHSALYPS